MLPALLTLAASLSAPAPAKARVAVPPIRVVGELEGHWHRLLREQLVRRLEKALTVVETDTDCSTPRCFQDAAAAAKADYVVAAVVSVTDDDYQITVRLIDGADGSAIAVGADGCEVCAVEEVGDLLADQTVILRQKVEAMANAPPTLRISSTPSGALVFVDGELVGQTPLTRTVGAGPHEIRAELHGHISATASVVAGPGEEHERTLTLTAIPRIQRAKPWAWGMLGAGALGLTAGVTLLVLDGRQYRLRCDGENVDEAGNCRFRYGTQTPGIVFTALGGATLITAAILLAVAHARRVTPTRNGIAIRF